MGHIQEHCDPPKLHRRRHRAARITGILWACDCGQVWRGQLTTSPSLDYHHQWFTWQKTNLTAEIEVI